MAKTAGILVIGNEILSGKTRDENSPFLARELRNLGVDVRKIAAIPDERDAIAGETRALSAACDYVFTSGGVGPTHDDLTMAGIALAFGRRIVRHSDLVAALSKLYPADLLDPNLGMADIPEGARLVGHGLVYPVIAVENVYIFPGVPELLRKKFESARERFRGIPFILKRVFVKQRESDIAPHLNELLQLFPELLMGSYPRIGEESFHVMLTLESRDAGYVQRALDALLQRIPERAIFKVE
jgi:molybdenum cofactor synthesis domain-containing protein